MFAVMTSPDSPEPAMRDALMVESYCGMTSAPPELRVERVMFEPSAFGYMTIIMDPAMRVPVPMAAQPYLTGLLICMKTSPFWLVAVVSGMFSS
jgi:hypothetical protein